jgi:ribonuclease J
MHGKRRKLTEEFLSSAKKLTPSVLVIEGTRAGSQTENVSEEEVYRNALCIVKRNPGKLVVADFGPRNFERMQTFLQIASQSGRTLLVLPKDMYLLEAISCAQDEWSLILEDAHLGIFDDVRVEKRAWDQVIRERYKGELVDAKSVRKYPGDFILAFSFWDIKHLLDIQPKEGVYIYSSSEPHCEEHVIDMRRLWNWLLHFGMKVYGFSLDESGNLTFSGGLHASGHASFPELINLIREIKPKHLIPIHTENASSFKEALRREPVQVHLLRNGAVFCL